MLTEKKVIQILCSAYEISEAQLFQIGHVSLQADSALQILIRWYIDIKILSVRDVQKKIGYKSLESVVHSLKKSENYINTDLVFRTVWYSVSENIPMRNKEKEKTVIRMLCQFFNVNKMSLKISSHLPHIASAKQLLVKWYKEVAGLSYPQIARKMCYADHTSGLHAYSRANEIFDTETRIKKFWYRLPGVDIFPQITSLQYRPK